MQYQSRSLKAFGPLKIGYTIQILQYVVMQQRRDLRADLGIPEKLDGGFWPLGST